MKNSPERRAEVKGFAKKSRQISSGKSPIKPRITRLEIHDKRTIKLYIRILGYLHGAFIRKSNGRLKYFFWNADRFSKKTGRFYSVRHLERAFPRFQRWCSEYHFERVNIGGVWRVRVTIDPSVQVGVAGSQIRARLEAAIRSYVATGGRARVDLEWCRKFSEISSLPLNGVEHVWTQLKNLPGLACRWRGKGKGRKFVCAAKFEKISRTDPQTSPPVSISYGNDKIKNSAPAAQSRRPEDSPLPAVAQGDASDTTHRLPRANALPGGCEHPGNVPPGRRFVPGLEPVQICGRFVSAKNLLRLAGWLAVGRLKFAHASRDRVVWRFAHARNFALRALRAGHAVREIESAYRSGLERSHQDALDADRLPGGGYASQREPSATVVYGWQALRSGDSRTPEQRWSEFFAAPRRGRLAPLTVPGRAPATAAPRLTAREAAEEVAKLRAIVKPAAAPKTALGSAAAVTLGELREFLGLRDLTIAKFNALPLPRKKWLMARAVEWREARKKK